MVFASGQSARAQTVAFSTFGPGNAYDSGLFQQAAGPSAGQTVTAFAFSSAATGAVASYDSVFQFIAGSPPNISINLYSDNGGKPGSLIDTSTLIATANTPTIYNIYSTLHPVLSSASLYWISAAGTGSSVYGWFNSSTGTTLPRANSNDNGATWTPNANDTPAAFRVTLAGAASAPEPGSIALLGMGLASGAPLLGIATRRHRKPA
jgi:hypothetical protein